MPLFAVIRGWFRRHVYFSKMYSPRNSHFCETEKNIDEKLRQTRFSGDTSCCWARPHSRYRCPHLARTGSRQAPKPTSGACKCASPNLPIPKPCAAFPAPNADQLKKDLLYGLFFRSNIPVGYGLGSSGALCAAVYDRYCKQKTGDLAELKTVFAGMERYFHGSSSGIDPLTSYLNKPLFIRNKTEVSVSAPAEWLTAPPVVFLLDTRLPRQTGPLVQWFLEKSGEPAFAERLNAELLPVHEAMVQAWMQADAAAFWPNLQGVSRFQLRHFEPMVPATIRDFWEKNLDHPDFAKFAAAAAAVLCWDLPETGKSRKNCPAVSE